MQSDQKVVRYPIIQQKSPASVQSLNSETKVESRAKGYYSRLKKPTNVLKLSFPDMNLNKPKTKQSITVKSSSSNSSLIDKYFKKKESSIASKERLTVAPKKFEPNMTYNS